LKQTKKSKKLKSHAAMAFLAQRDTAKNPSFLDAVVVLVQHSAFVKRIIITQSTLSNSIRGTALEGR
jgi:hypothetical protein